MTKLTKIVATIGPASGSEDTLKDMIQAGMNVARFNTKHADPQWHDEHIRRVLKVAKELNTTVAILLDLQGPEVRIDLPGKKSFTLAKGQEATFTEDTSVKETRTVYIPNLVIQSMNVGDQIMLEDGAAELVVTAKEPNMLRAQAVDTCTINNRKTLNTPGVILDMPSLTTRDFAYLDHIDPKLIDFVGLSFVRNTRDIDILRTELKKRSFKADVISKIENQKAIDNIDSIIEASDAIMIARGDLGVEVPFQQLIYWQKMIIAKCRSVAKPVITATEMLESMIEKPRPTRAEVSDVAHAVYDGTDAVMLSGETTAGKYPVRAVATQASIAAFNEAHTEALFECEPDFDIESAISMSAVFILENSSIVIDKIICLSEHGQTARLVSRFRPHVPIVTLTSNIDVQRKLQLSYAVESYHFTGDTQHIKTQEQIVEIAKQNQLIATGDTVLILHSPTWQAGLTNTLTICKVE